MAITRNPLKVFIQRLYVVYATVAFVVLFLIFFWPLLFPIIRPSAFRWVGIINRWWGKCIFSSWLIPVSVEVRGQTDPKGQYIFCPNHFSYIDIPLMAWNPHNAVFVGKHDMERIPLFGFMYRRLHITVDRSKLRSRYSTFLKCAEAIDQGKSLVIFPEGGIVSGDPPRMARFKDGPFRLSFEKGIPIIPVTIPDNWRLMPDSPWDFVPGKTRLIFHEPVLPGEYQDVDELKQAVYQVIQTELNHVHSTGSTAQDGALVPS